MSFQTISQSLKELDDHITKANESIEKLEFQFRFANKDIKQAREIIENKVCRSYDGSVLADGDGDSLRGFLDNTIHHLDHYSYIMCFELRKLKYIFYKQLTPVIKNIETCDDFDGVLPDSKVSVETAIYNFDRMFVSFMKDFDNMVDEAEDEFSGFKWKPRPP